MHLAAHFTINTSMESVYSCNSEHIYIPHECGSTEECNVAIACGNGCARLTVGCVVCFEECDYCGEWKCEACFPANSAEWLLCNSCKNDGVTSELITFSLENDHFFQSTMGLERIKRPLNCFFLWCSEHRKEVTVN